MISFSLLLTDRGSPDYDECVRRYGVFLSPPKGAFTRRVSARDQSEPEPEREPSIDPSTLSDEERAVYQALTSPMTSDELSRAGLDPSVVLAALTTLEIRGCVRPLPGGRYERAN